MSSNLVIVESPAKAKTIEKFLGKGFKVVSCFGHISDLPSSGLGIDLDNNYLPRYEVVSDKKKLVSDLKKMSKKASLVWLASDEDREGEAIAWHLKQQLQLQESHTKRIAFQEITKKAITKAIQNPREIDYQRVDAQQARRVLDRLVGYELSPVLWKKIKSGLSAGRVQSVAVRLIVEREREIMNFEIEAFYRVVAHFSDDLGNVFKAQLKQKITEEATVKEALSIFDKGGFKVEDLQKKPAQSSPAAPFTTSTLQQEASRKLGFNVSRTMRVAQRLYESGRITYMRTDSVNLSDDAKQAIQQQVITNYGAPYSKVRNFKNKSKSSQEAHEAIRPTDFANHRIIGDRDESRLYELIWKRTVASQMSNARLQRTQMIIGHQASDYKFNAQGEVIVFDGFLKIYLESKDQEDDADNATMSTVLPDLKVNAPLSYQEITATERFTQPPYRFTEASLVKKMEELGIGRPSTYAPTISTIQARGYVERGQFEGRVRPYQTYTLKQGKLTSLKKKEKMGSNKGKLVPTDTGKVVTDFLLMYFANVLDYGFTAKVETDFDRIATGKMDWTKMIDQFYKKFHPKVEDVVVNAERESGERILGIDPASKKQVSVRLGRFGPMAQVGNRDDKDKKFASLNNNQQLEAITLEEALDLFLLPKDLGTYEEAIVTVANGRYGPYVKFGKQYISLPKNKDPLDVTFEDAVALIVQKQEADKPIATHDDLPVQKGVGRFGPYLKWNNIFINVNKKYDFDNLSKEDIYELIETKKQKERDKLIHHWEEDDIRVEKARWGRFNVIQGKIKVELPKDTVIQQMTLTEAKKIISLKNVKNNKKRVVRNK